MYVLDLIKFLPVSLFLHCGVVIESSMRVTQGHSTDNDKQISHEQNDSEDLCLSILPSRVPLIKLRCVYFRRTQSNRLGASLFIACSGLPSRGHSAHLC